MKNKKAVQNPFEQKIVLQPLTIKLGPNIGFPDKVKRAQEVLEKIGVAKIQKNK